MMAIAIIINSINIGKIEKITFIYLLLSDNYYLYFFVLKFKMSIQSILVF